MKVGLFVTNQQYLTTDMVSALDDQIAMVRLVRDKGWDSLFSGQHYLNEGNNQQLQIVPFLARLIPEAGEMHLGLGILLLNLHGQVVAVTVHCHFNRLAADLAIQYLHDIDIVLLINFYFIRFHAIGAVK